MFYIISGAAGELSEKELAAAASATMTMTTKFIHSHHHHKRSIYYCMEVFQHQREIKEKSKEEIPTSWSHQHNTLHIIMIDFFL